MTTSIGRRNFITLLGGAAASWPMAGWAQQSMPIIGFLGSGALSTSAQNVAAFREGLKEAGYVEGQNVAFEYRWAENHYERIQPMAADLVRRRVAVIAAPGAPAAVPASKETATIPILFYLAEDPVQLGFVNSYNRPGKNLTGVAVLNSALLAKRMELLRDLVPQATVIAALVNPKNPNAETSTKDAQEAARMLGRQIHIFSASTEGEIQAVFASLAQIKAGALLLAPDAFFNTQVNSLAALTARYKMPSIFQLREFATAGGLVSYGPSITDGFRQMGVYAGRILKGERPADLPVLQPTKFELVINLKTAKTLGVTVPLPLLALADEVIE